MPAHDWFLLVIAIVDLIGGAIIISFAPIRISGFGMVPAVIGMLMIGFLIVHLRCCA